MLMTPLAMSQYTEVVILYEFTRNEENPSPTIIPEWGWVITDEEKSVETLIFVRAKLFATHPHAQLNMRDGNFLSSVWLE